MKKVFESKVSNVCVVILLSFVLLVVALFTVYNVYTSGEERRDIPFKKDDDCTTVTRYVCMNDSCDIIDFTKTTACYNGEEVISASGTETSMKVPSGYYIGDFYEIKTCLGGKKCCIITEFLKDGIAFARARSTGCYDQ